MLEHLGLLEEELRLGFDGYFLPRRLIEALNQTTMFDLGSHRHRLADTYERKSALL